ncbi:MAG: helix-turn-helix transcriptional regulator [Clostridia bacterium]|nr:helix-turn-helix transcriptional regulator [Clostridia bacterium]
MDTPSRREQLHKDISVTHCADPNPGTVHTCHMHDAPEVLLVVQGQLTVTVNERTIRVSDGDLLLFNPAELHTIVSHGPVFERYVLYFRPDFLRDLSSGAVHPMECFYVRADGAEANRIRLTEPELQGLRDELESIAALCEADAQLYGRETELQYRTGLLLLHINRLHRTQEHPAADTESEEARQICAITDYIQKNIDGELSLKTLAAAHYMDKNRLCALFRQMLGTSPRQYIVRARIAAAQRMLQQGESIDRVCGRCGFNSLAHFSRTFKAHTGIPPSQFAREKML